MKQGSFTLGVLSALFAASVLAATAPSQPAVGNQKSLFRLTRGHGLQICEAYLKRLNQTAYQEPPYCGRPENDQIPGFERLQRVALAPEEVVGLFGQIGAFMLSGKSIPPQLLDPEATRLLLGAARTESNEMFYWRYRPRMDIENNGTSDNVVVWQPTGNAGLPCGSTRFPNGDQAAAGYVRQQLAFVLSDDGKRLDDDKTRLLFGHPTGGHAVPEPTPFVDTGPGYQPIGSSMSIFKYRGIFYFDTFFDGGGWADFDGKRAKLASLRNHLAVFLRQEGRTREMCEYVYNPKAKTFP